jgi:capsular polysaccharide transport system permease protein
MNVGGVKRLPKLWFAGLLLSLLFSVYWLLLASDRYVSEAQVIVQRADLPGGGQPAVGGLLAGVLGSGPQHADAQLLRSYLLSVDTLQRLESQLGLRVHFSQSEADWVSRLWRTELEWLHQHYLERVNIQFDEISGTLRIQAQAYSPAMAKAIVHALVQEGERYMNALARQLAQEQVSFLEGQVEGMQVDLTQAREALLAFQNKAGLVSPQATVEGLSAVLNQLESRRAELEAERSTLLSFLVPGHPRVVQIEQQLQGLSKQIAAEGARLATPRGNALNRAVEQVQRLEFEAGFAQERYRSALAALEAGRVEAARQVKKVGVVQSPTLPEDSLQPRRLHNTLVSTLIIFLLTGIAQLVRAVVREHQD